MISTPRSSFAAAARMLVWRCVPPEYCDTAPCCSILTLLNSSTGLDCSAQPLSRQRPAAFCGRARTVSQDHRVYDLERCAELLGTRGSRHVLQACLSRTHCWLGCGSPYATPSGQTCECVPCCEQAWVAGHLPHAVDLLAEHPPPVHCRHCP